MHQRVTAAAHMPMLALGGLVLLLAPPLAGAGATLAPGQARDAAQLRQMAETAVGAPVALDPRLQVPGCASPFRFTPGAGGRSVEILCPPTGWRIVAPVAASGMGGAAPGQPAARAPALVRRGDLVTVAHSAPGLAITVEAIAEGTGAAGDRIILRNRITGARFPATIGADGTLASAR